MKRVLGFACFCVSMGMLLILLIPNDFVGFLIAIGLLVVGYQLFCCGGKK